MTKVDEILDLLFSDLQTIQVLMKNLEKAYNSFGKEMGDLTLSCWSHGPYGRIHQYTHLIYDKNTSDLSAHQKILLKQRKNNLKAAVSSTQKNMEKLSRIMSRSPACAILHKWPSIAFNISKTDIKAFIRMKSDLRYEHRVTQPHLSFSSSFLKESFNIVAEGKGIGVGTLWSIQGMADIKAENQALAVKWLAATQYHDIFTCRSYNLRITG